MYNTGAIFEFIMTVVKFCMTEKIQQRVCKLLNGLYRCLYTVDEYNWVATFFLYVPESNGQQFLYTCTVQQADTAVAAFTLFYGNIHRGP